MDTIVEMLEETYSVLEIKEFLEEVTKDKIEKYVISRGICPSCNYNLMLRTWKEEREYMGSLVYEEMAEYYCSGCGETY